MFKAPRSSVSLIQNLIKEQKRIILRKTDRLIDILSFSRLTLKLISCPYLGGVHFWRQLDPNPRGAISWKLQVSFREVHIRLCQNFHPQLNLKTFRHTKLSWGAWILSSLFMKSTKVFYKKIFMSRHLIFCCHWDYCKVI